MNGSPEWCLRTWHKGDRLSPFGMKGSRLVSDIFKDAKFTQDQKDSTLLLFRNDELIWIAGVRASRHFPITEQTQSVIQIKLR
ncbi:tRNA lysidine(34) synthetase TilS [Duncaniella freteri]|uniref:tRNA lysidine(34) synthetase TilS n=3 Tax=Duncaniella TaxID=2518495 RepID=UPI0025732762|nr:tRNA lysidine(34) synthetase TilS [Duncaniella freteri]